MLVCAFLVLFARETAGAARTRSSLRPLTTEGGTFPLKTRAKFAARSRSRNSEYREAVSWTTVIACDKREAFVQGTRMRGIQYPQHLLSTEMLVFTGSPSR